MTPGFLRGDELIQSSSGELLYVVRGVIPRIQRVKVLDMACRNEVLVDEADLRPKVASGERKDAVIDEGLRLLAKLDAAGQLTDDQKGWSESFNTLRNNGAQETGTAGQ